MNKIVLILISVSAFLSAYPSNPVDHVIFIGIDGWTSDSFNQADIPTIQSIADNGCYTLKKRTVLPSSSAPNWASMFMGVPVEFHGYTQWNSTSPEFPSPIESMQNRIPPTIFQIIKEEIPNYRTCCLYEWEGIKHMIDTVSCDYHAIAEEPLGNPERLTDMACEYIRKQKPNLLAVIYDGVDHTGHAAGFDSDEYLSMLNFVDGQISRIIEAVRTAEILDKTVFIVTSDHGGIGNNHGGISLEELETPFIIAGNGIKQGFEIPEFMMQYDVASIVLDLFDVEQPYFWRGRCFESIRSENASSSANRVSMNTNSNKLYYDLMGNFFKEKPYTGVVMHQSIDNDGKVSVTKHLNK